MNRKLFNLVIILLILSSGITQAQKRVRYKAIPKEGYQFKQWEDGVTTNPRIIDLSNIPDELINTPSISVSNPTTNRLSDNKILTMMQGIILQEILDNSNNPLTSLSSSVSIPAIKAIFEKNTGLSPGDYVGELQVDTNGNLVGTEYTPCENINMHFYFKHVPKGDVTIDNKTFTTTYDYYMLDQEVSQRMWKYVMNCNNPSNWPDDGNPLEKVSWYDVIYFCNKLSGFLGLDKVYSISGTKDESQWGAIPTSNDTTWNAVVCDWTANGVRLPTEVEWMHAAKEGINSSYIYSGTTDYLTWYAIVKTNKTARCKNRWSNALQLFDMTGNVWEWCWDWYGDLPNGGIDYRGPSLGTNRMNKGGCYSSQPQEALLENRNSTTPATKVQNIGFRILVVPN